MSKSKSTKYVIETMDVEDMPSKMHGAHTELVDAITSIKAESKGICVQIDKSIAANVRTSVYRKYPRKYDIWYRNGYLYAKLNPYYKEK